MPASDALMQSSLGFGSDWGAAFNVCWFDLDRLDAGNPSTLPDAGSIATGKCLTLQS
jgi:hypothetical protein